MNTYHYVIYHISLKMVWWVLPNISSIVQICLAVHEILANKAFIVTDDLISWLFVVTFVHSTYMQIAFIWRFTVQLSLWKLVYWLWRYKLNEVCDITSSFGLSFVEKSYMLFWSFLKIFLKLLFCILKIFLILLYILFLIESLPSNKTSFTTFHFS